MRRKIKKPLQAITVLVFAAIFIALGIWQLQRAQELQNAKKIVADTTIYPLAQMASAAGSVPPESILKFVTTTGHYIATYKAPKAAQEPKPRRCKSSACRPQTSPIFRPSKHF